MRTTISGEIRTSTCSLQPATASRTTVEVFEDQFWLWAIAPCLNIDGSGLDAFVWIGGR